MASDSCEKLRIAALYFGTKSAILGAEENERNGKENLESREAEWYGNQYF